MQTEAKFSANVGELVHVETAKKWISNHNTHTNSVLQKGGCTIKSIFFGKDAITNLINTPGAVGIRIHFAVDEHGAKKLVLYPADETGSNIEMFDIKNAAVALDGGLPCPPVCPPKDPKPPENV